MRARFQTDVDGGFLQEALVLDGADGVYFGMGFSAADVVAFADNGVVVYYHRPYHGVWSCIAKAVLGQLNAPGDIFFVFCHRDS